MVESVKSVPYIAEPLEESVTVVPPVGAALSSAAVMGRLPPSARAARALIVSLPGMDGVAVAVSFAAAVEVAVGVCVAPSLG